MGTVLPDVSETKSVPFDRQLPVCLKVIDSSSFRSACRRHGPMSRSIDDSLNFSLVQSVHPPSPMARISNSEVSAAAIHPWATRKYNQAPKPQMAGTSSPNSV